MHSQQTPPGRASHQDSDLLPALGIATAVLVVFSQVRSFAFINFDDNEYVTENPFVRSGLSVENVRWAFTNFHAGHFHPLTWLSHMVDCSLFGMDAGAHHLVNAAFHAVNTALVFLLLRRMDAPTARSVLVAALFGLHPLRVESVAWVTGRKDMLSMFFLLLALHAHVGWVQRRAVVLMVATWCAQVLGLLSKPTVIVLPVLLLLVDHWPLQRHQSGERWRALVVEKTPMFLLSAGSALLTILGQRAAYALVDTQAVPLDLRLANAAASLVGYLGQWMWPVNLAVFYPLRPPGPGVAAVGVLGVTAVSALAWTQRARRPWLLTGWAWYLVALAPVIGLVQVGGQSMADRYLFIPSMGLAFIMTWGAAESWQRWQLAPRWLRALSAAWVVGLAALTAWQLGHWKDSETLFRRALAVVPDNFMAHTNLGVALDAQGRFDEATVHHQEAVRLHPSYPPARNNLGNARARQGRYAEAAEHYAAALAVQPTLTMARYNLALALAYQGRTDEAEQGFRDVLRHAPTHALAHLSLADILWKRGALVEAEGHLHDAVEHAPEWVEAQRRHGLILAALGRRDEAVARLQESLRHHPGDAELQAALQAVSAPAPENRGP